MILPDIDGPAHACNTAAVELPRYSIRLSDGREFGPAPMDLVLQWAREGRVPPDSLLVPSDGSPIRSVLSDPALRAIVQKPATPPTISTGLPAPKDDAVSVLIPYRNPAALTGYYISIASLFPLLGAIAGPAAIVLGITGIRRRKADPKLHGLAHAWIAIILGLLGTLISAGCITSIIVSAVSRH